MREGRDGAGLLAGSKSHSGRAAQSVAFPRAGEGAALPDGVPVSAGRHTVTKRGIRGWIRAVAGLVGDALDGMIAGFATVYVIVTTVSGSTRAIALGPVGDMALTAVLVIAALGITTGVLVAIFRAAGWLRSRIQRATDRGRVVRALGAVVATPFGLIAAVPASVALMAALLLVIFVLGRTGLGGLVTPDSALAPYIWFGAGVGAALGLARAASRRIPRTAPRVRLGLTGSALVVAIVAGIAGTAVLLDPGSDTHLVRPTSGLDGAAHSATTLEDPGARGQHSVTTFTYGSGVDKRAAYGTDVLLRTPTVDASRAISPIGGGADEARRWYWGFGVEALPLNGRVWMPGGDGPFPLVLIVHGNHAMGAESEAGYAYLADHLASRGFIGVSIDENFLNGSWAGDYHGSEQAVRAWLLLLHLDQWRTWNADAAGPLAGRVDMDRVALVGHSRGGEAASVATELSSLDGSFNPALKPWPTGLTVHAVVSIAPSDGQYGPDVRLAGDRLTGLTTMAILDELETVLAGVPGLAALPIEAAFLDLAGFGDFNSRQGQVAGDEVLATRGASLSDLDGVLPVRIGGDEFLLFGKPGAVSGSLAASLEPWRDQWAVAMAVDHPTECVAPRIVWSD